MDIHYIAAIAAGLLTVISVIPYIYGMLRGTTRPNIVTWGLWFLIQGIFAAAQFSAGASFSIILPIAEVVTVGVTVTLGLIGFGYKKYGWLDIICLVIALAAIVLWQITSNPLLALWMSVIADLIAATPTLFKAYRDPGSETLANYLLVALAAIMAAFSSTIIDIPNLLWPAYIFGVNVAVAILIVLGKRRHERSID